MQAIAFANAYFVKLGKGGKFAQSSFTSNKIRFGWLELNLEDIRRWNQEDIREKERLARVRVGLPDGKTVISNDISALGKIVHSTSSDVWITFDGPYLWWCRVADTPVDEDAISRYRSVSVPWSNCDAHGGRLITNQISGRLTKIQRFSGTICGLGPTETADLRRLLNGDQSDESKSIVQAKAVLVSRVADSMSLLHWKDFELLVDLIFRSAGWQRMTVVGESLKYVDMVLEQPITHHKYQVQVKSDASLADFQKYAQDFALGKQDFERLYFVVHSPKAKWASAPKYEDVELVCQEDLAEMVVDMGLIGWLQKKIR